MPYATGVQHAETGSESKILSLRTTLLRLGMALAYWAVIIPFAKPLFHLLYSGRYMEVEYQIPTVAIGSIFWSAAYGPALALRGMKSPASVFAAYTFAAVASLAIERNLGVRIAWRHLAP